MAFKSYREQSKVDWGTESDSLTAEQIQTGALLRIADAVEKVAADYTAIRNSRDYWQTRAIAHWTAGERMARRIRSLHGVITRMKKR